MTQIEKTKRYPGFKVPNSDVIWRPNEYQNDGVMGVVEIKDQEDDETFITSRWFTEEDLKDAIFYELTPEK